MRDGPVRLSWNRVGRGASLEILAFVTLEFREFHRSNHDAHHILRISSMITILYVESKCRGRN